jgi:hypothetical protein
MASLTIAIDPEILEAARVEAERRKTSLDQMVAEFFTSVTREAESKRNSQELVRLMNEGVLGAIDRPLTREEIYAERMRWPRS